MRKKRLYRALAIPCLALLSACTTPTSQPAVTGQNKATATQYIRYGSTIEAGSELAKYTVGIRIYESMRNFMTCTGTIIAKRIILTAAHCFPESPFRVDVVFSNQIRESRPELVLHPAGKATIKNWTDLATDLTPGSEQRRSYYDIALVSLDQDIPSSHAILDLIETAEEQNSNHIFYSVGFGRSEKEGQFDGLLRQGILLKKPGTTSGNEELLDFDGSEGHGPDHGDSGGPAILPTGNGWKLAGICGHTLTRESDNHYLGSRYVNIIPLRTWILATSLEMLARGNK